MAIRIKFDSNNNVQAPTFVLATRSGKKLGTIPVYNITFGDNMNSYSEVFFKVAKYDNGSEYYLWNNVKDFKLVYCPEWKALFEINVEIDESNELVKNVSAKSLGESELSQINLYEIEINTENDIARDDYVPSVLFDQSNANASTLNRIMEKAPHYRIVHVDSSIASIQRTFTFDRVSMYDAFQTIAKEIHCIFIIDTGFDENGNIDRTISVYDIESYCLDCGERSEFTNTCPECGSTNFISGYGKDTTIFISSGNLADNITYSTDVASVKNCFKLVAGDDLMTATLVNCNPNGSGYIWFISDDVKEDMSDELVSKLEEYDSRYNYYQNEHETKIPNELFSQYNSLVEKYSKYSATLRKVPASIVGYPDLLNYCYDAIDFELYLSSGLMPNVDIQDTSAEIEAAKLNKSNMPYIAVTNIDTCSNATASSSALSLARAIIDPRYQVKVNDSNLIGTAWMGNFIVTNYSDEEDTAISESISITITSDYEEYVKQKLNKTLQKDSDDITDIAELFRLNAIDFIDEIKKYSLSRLVSFQDSCQACLNILIEQGIADKQTWTNSDKNLYESLYMPYYDKLTYLQSEIKLRESEISLIVGLYDAEGTLISHGLKSFIEGERKIIQDSLNFESFIGEDLWIEFISYRREDTYQNNNYISDGLDNAELFKNALEFIEVAKKDIIKSATLQHSISATLKNLLVLKEFRPLINYFEVGNWIRIKVDNSVYRLRLIEYKINFEDLDNIDVTFSDVSITSSGMSDAKSILSQAASMATSYGTVSRQAELGKRSSDQVSDWNNKGIALTNTRIFSDERNKNISWDSNEMMFKRYDDEVGDYDGCQLKIINSTMSITDDNWASVKTAIGGYYYTDPETGKLKYAYGVNADVLIGKLILGEKLGIYNESGSLSFDSNGFLITNGINSFKVDPNDEILLSISNGVENVFYVDKDGRLYITADGADLDLASNETIRYLVSKTDSNADAIAKESNRATLAENDLSVRIDANSVSISDETERATKAEADLLAKIDNDSENLSQELADAIQAETDRAMLAENDLLSKIQSNSTAISNETNRATNAESKLDEKILENSSSINDEVERATKAELDLSDMISENASNLAEEIKRSTDADNSLTSLANTNAQSISAEIERSTKRDDELSTQIDTISDAISAESDRAIAAEDELSKRITSNQDGIEAETERAISAENDLLERITDVEGLMTTEAITSWVEF